MIRRLPESAVPEHGIRRAGWSKKVAPLAVADTTQEIESAEVEGYRKGYAEGFEAGELDGLHDAEARMQVLEEEAVRRGKELAFQEERLRHFIDGLDDALERHEQGMRPLAYELALMSLSRAFGQMQQDQSLLQRLCTQVAEEFRAKAIRLCVPAADLACLPDAIDGLDVVADPALSAGTYRIVTDRGHMETSIDMRLASIYRAMREALGIDPP